MMNRRLLTLLAALSAGTFVLLAAVFFGAAYYSGEKSVASVSKDIHATYLREFVYNYKNELVSGNYRFFRNQIASLMDHQVFSDYAILQNGREVEASERFAEHAGRAGYLRISVPVWFNEEKTELWGTVDLLVSDNQTDRVERALRDGMHFFLGLLLLASLLLAALYASIWQRLNLGLGREVEAVFAGRPGPARGIAGLLWRPTLEKLRALKASRDDLAKRDVEAQKQLTMVEITRQVAHDIRSPLATLNLVSTQLPEVEEEKRLLIRHAVQRIRDIANDLDLRGVAADTAASRAPELAMLSSLVDLVVSEKRVQYRDRAGVQIEAEISAGYGLFAQLHAPGVRRALSNLIDNGVEALRSEGGTVAVSLTESGGKARISVRDDGRGIPRALLGKVGEKGVSFGKKGSGLGLHQARTATVESGGECVIESEEGQGTTVTLAFPLAPCPQWFLGTLRLPNDAVIVTVDDDIAIHALWRNRISSNPLAQLKSLAEASDWLARQASGKGRRLFLFDYEFQGENENGLDVIDRLGLAPESVLVTSRFDDQSVQERCRRLGVKMIPKGLASMVPVSVLRG